MHRPWPGPAAYDAAPVNAHTQPRHARADLNVNRSAVEAFPTVADLAQIWLAIQDAKRGDRP